MSALKFNLLDGTISASSRHSLTCAPSPPPAPDYAGAAQQQGAANLKTAEAQGRINNPNVINPYGTQTVTWDKHTPTLTQTFSPEQQALYDQSTGTQLQLGQVAGQGAEALQGVVGTGVDFSGAPQTGSYDTTRRSVIDAMMGRANEDYLKRMDTDRSNLIAAGIRPGSKAYDDNQQMIERSRNDARQQAEIAGGNAASQAYGMDADRRRQAITEYLAQRQTPLNEITALLSGSQVSNPFSMPGYAQNTQVGQTPVFGAAQQAGDWEADMYNAQAAAASNQQSGLMGLGGAGIMGGAMAFSDRRLKSNIRRIGTHPLGIGLYEYDIFGRHERGVMADEVQTVRPDAVVTLPNGLMGVDYGRL